MLADRLMSLMMEGFTIITFWNKPNMCVISRIIKVDADGLLIQSEIGLKSQDYLDETTYLDVIMGQVDDINNKQLDRMRTDIDKCPHDLMKVEGYDTAGNYYTRDICRNCRKAFDIVKKQKLELNLQ